jgi:hypothetical protein
LFQQLREHGVEHLGQVAYAYLETDGELTVFRSRSSRPGLPIVPPWEIEAPAALGFGELTREREIAACEQCGTIADLKHATCPHCNHDMWVPARGQVTK